MADAMVKLPKWEPPKNEVVGESELRGFFGSLREHMYFAGKHLIWFKARKKHGEFLPWLDAKFGMTKKTAYNWIALAKACDSAGRLLLPADTKSVNSTLLQSSPIPAGKYGVIYADPPWAYSNSGFEQSAASHYPTMPTEEICALPVNDLATESTVLYMWATVPLLNEGFRVLSAWGFDYKTALFWVKDKAPGIRFWYRNRVEMLLVGACGKTPPPRSEDSNIISGEVTKHSRKPDSVYMLIENNHEGPYIELFARPPVREGWVAWGNEIENRN